MSEGRGTLQLIAEQVAGALRPLEDAFRDPDQFRVLLLQLGWDAPGLPPSYVAVADEAVQAGEALRALTDDAGIDDVLRVVTKAGDVYRAVHALNEAPAGIDPAVFLPEIGRRLFELLLGQQLLAQAPRWFAALQAIGIIVLEDTPETDHRPGFTRLRFDWEQIPEILRHPGVIPARVYGWSTPALNFNRIAEHLGQVVIALGVPTSMDQLSPQLAGALQAGTSAPPARPATRALTAVLFDVPIDGTYVEVGLMLAELPAEGSSLPGVILQPFVPSGIAERVELGLGWAFVLRAATDLSQQLALVIRPGDVKVRYPFAPGQVLPSGGFGISLVYDAATPLVIFGEPARTRLELSSASVGLGIDVRAGDLELTTSAGIQKLSLVVSAEGADGFLASVLGGKDLRVDAQLALSWSNRAGLSFTAGGGFAVTVFPHLDLGFIRIDRVDLAVQAGAGAAPALQVRASAGFSGDLGPVTFSVDRLGVQLPVTFADGNAGPFDVGLKPLLPSGVGIAVDARAVVGGGFLSFDFEKQEYSGVLELQIEDTIAVKAIGLLVTKLPDAARGYSLLVIITAEGFQPIPLGLGFNLTGIGGLLAINRTFDEDALRAGLRNHTLDSVMFPHDPIRNAPQILSNLNRVFPPAPGHHLFGPVAQITWGTPALITANLALVLEIGARLRLLILAQVAAVLPSPTQDLIRLQMDAVGVIDFDQGTAALDATLHDSRLLRKFPLTGDMALRLSWETNPAFALAVGGLHPAFQPPPGFPKLARIALSLGTGDNPRLRCEAYFAITANTVQFGAHAELSASAAGFTLQGQAGFDVLIQLAPFAFLAEFYAQLQLKRGSTNLFKVRVEGALAGPRPLHLKAKATFEILWWDVTVRVDATLVDGERPPLPAPVDVFALLSDALNSASNWTSQLPTGQRQVVTFRAATAAAADTLLHPLGTLAIKQTVVPLDLDISRFGATPPAGARRFSITSVVLGGHAQTAQPLRDFFAPAQFIEMTDGEKLARPSFESMTGGVSVGSALFAITPNAADCLEVPAIEFETLIVDPNGDTRSSPPPGQAPRYRLTPILLGTQARFGAAAASALRRTGKARYRSTADKYQVARDGWSVATTDDLAVQTAPTSYSEAVEALTTLTQQQPAKARALTILRRSELSVA